MIVSAPAAKTVVRRVVQAKKVAPAKVAVRGTILAKQVNAAKPAQRVEVSACGPCGDNGNDNHNNQQCQPISFEGCECTDIMLEDCIDSTILNADGLNQVIEDNLGSAEDIAFCLSNSCGTEVTADNITVTDIPAMDQNPTRNGGISKRIRIFTVTDACGQSATLVRSVSFRDTASTLVDPVTGLPIPVGPQTTCPADRIIAANTPLNQIRFDPPFFSSACGPTDITVTPAQNSPFYDPTIDVTAVDVDGNTTYTRTYTATDGCGNVTICTQIITARDCPTLGPSGCTTAYWLSEEGQTFWDSLTDPLVLAMPAAHRFTPDTKAFQL
ncbi:MAG: hypothetical protein ABIS18_06165, partial [Actinomycetota bacterium]